MSNQETDKLIQWSTMAIPVLVEAGLDPTFSAMFKKNLATGKTKFVQATAVELAEMFLELPGPVREESISRLQVATGLTPSQILRRSEEKVRTILSRQKVRNLAEFRVIDEALNEQRLEGSEAELAAVLQAEFVRSQKNGA